MTGATSARRHDVRGTILDAAERVFSLVGFEGASTRAIAEEAKVNLGLIHYHFGSKDGLFEQVIARGSAEVNSRRKELLSAALAHEGDDMLERILEALMRPMIEVSYGECEGKAYGRIIVQISTGTDDRSTQLTGQYFNDIAREFIQALQDYVPMLGKENAVWAYMNAISVGQLMMARTGRIAVLSDGICDESDTEAFVRRTVNYLAAGTRSLIA